jgi:hypothetical protein
MNTSKRGRRCEAPLAYLLTHERRDGRLILEWGNMKKLALGLAAAASAAVMASSAGAVTSPVFETNYGVALVGGDDQVGGGTLPFAFTLFDQSYTTYGVSTNGFLTLGAGAPSGCCNGNVTEFLAGAARIAPEWFDIVGSVYVNTEVADRAVFTFTGYEYNGGGSYAAQAQLFANGQIIFGYSSDSVPNPHVVLTGITAGGGAADPGEQDLTNGPFFTGANRAVYDLAAAGTFDLNGANVYFTPDGQGGYTVSNTAAVGGVPEPAAWALMIGGFFGAGTAIRARRRHQLA